MWHGQVLNYDKSGKMFRYKQLSPSVFAHLMSLQNDILYIIACSWFVLVNAVSNCTLHAFLVYFPHVLFSLFVIFHYYCRYYVFKYGILCISLHVPWEPVMKIYIGIPIIGIPIIKIRRSYDRLIFIMELTHLERGSLYIYIYTYIAKLPSGECHKTSLMISQHWFM